MSPKEQLTSAGEEERLRRELQQAREAFERALNESHAAAQTAGTLDPDEPYAFRKVYSHYSAALERYSTALRNFRSTS